MKRPSRATKTNKTIDRLLKQTQCRECSVVVTKMDFAKILGKFTKVKIQYESNTPAKPKKVAKETISPRTAVNNSRLKRNENGMVQIHRTAYNKHPVKKLLSPKGLANIARDSSTPQILNILKENNRLKKSTPLKEKKVSQNKRNNNQSSKHYAIIFENPKIKGREMRNDITLLDLLPSIDDSLLPSGEWRIEFLPKLEEPKNDKVYDKIAAELEELMSIDKDYVPPVNEAISNKGDDFPSILDILNDNTDVKEQKNKNYSSSKTTASDVESILLGNDKSPEKSTELNNSLNEITNIDEPGSPSILDEALQTGIEKQIPKKLNKSPSKNAKSLKKETTSKTKSKVTHVIFKQSKSSNSYKSVTCPKNLKYGIDIDGKPVELLGAPKFITSLEDLRVLLQIVNESQTGSFYIVQPNT